MGSSDCRTALRVAQVGSPLFATLTGWTRAPLCAVAAWAFVFAPAGCVSRGKPAVHAVAAASGPKSDRYKVTAAATDFYTYGPQQPNGPDQSLKKDARLTMVSRSFGYSRVTTPDGKTGYVGTEDIAPLTADEIAEEVAALQPPAPVEAPQRLGGSYTIPPEAGNEERLPVADPLPSPKPVLSTPFRY